MGDGPCLSEMGQCWRAPERLTGLFLAAKILAEMRNSGFFCPFPVVAIC